MASKKEISRLLKANIIDYTWFEGLPLYGTRKSYKNQKYSPFFMRSGKNRTKLRSVENRKYRRDKFNLASHKKVGIAYIWNIW